MSLNRNQIETLIDKIYEQMPEKDMVLPDRTFRMFEKPLLGIGSAADEYFVSEFKKQGAIGPWFKTPQEWLDGAKSVISLFFPMSELVKKSNYGNLSEPSLEWLCCRIEGQAFIKKFTLTLLDELEKSGIRAVAPSTSGEFKDYYNSDPYGGENKAYSSNWSERHAAFVCGLGTFGLSKGLITKAGIAGRFTSVITDLEIEADIRHYTDIYEYCTHCGACIARCPANAIDQVEKHHIPCHEFQKIVGAKNKPRFGCGKCQTQVPCQSGIPKNELAKSLDKYLQENYEEPCELSPQACESAKPEEKHIKLPRLFAAKSFKPADFAGSASFEAAAFPEESFVTDEGFSEKLLRIIDEKGLKDSDVYNKAQLSRQVFNKIKNMAEYHPGKTVVFALVCALELPLSDCEDLLNRAGYAFSKSSKLDLIVKFCIENNIYDILKINDILFRYDQELLGSKM